STPTHRSLSPQHLLSFSLLSFFYSHPDPRHLHSFPTRRSSDLNTTTETASDRIALRPAASRADGGTARAGAARWRHHSTWAPARSEEHTSELQSRFDLVCRLLLEKKKKKEQISTINTELSK